MNDQQVRDIAEAAFKARFRDIGIVSINVKPGFGLAPGRFGIALCTPAEALRRIAG